MDSATPIKEGRMKSLIVLWREVSIEFGDQCSVSTTRDLQTITRRIEHEGLSFLTITLPQFASDFQKSLADGKVDRNLFQGFTWQAGLPRFLGGFLDLVFDRESGVLVDEPDINAIQAIRQLTLMYGKLELPAADHRRDKTLRGFIDTETEVKRFDLLRTSGETLEFRAMSNRIWGEVLSRVDFSLAKEQREVGGFYDPQWPYVVPKHGPGATADRVSGNGKYDFCEWTDRLERVFPFGEYALPNWRHHSLLDRVDFRDPGTERPVRVITVPKTLKAPRIIAIEPSYMQYMQQGVQALLVDSIRSDSALGTVVGFDDQWRNHALALQGSRDGSLATLDLSEASDRVSNQLVRAMLQSWPHIHEAVDATRSRKADVPGGGVIRLAKFASMGSALTFPVEAMVFMTVVAIGIEKSLGRRLTRKDIQSFRNRVRVYGDDIIVPAEYAESVRASLELYGFKVNSSKSFWNGLFRESCGKEYYDGHDVSVVRVRRVVPNGTDADLPSSRTHVSETESTVALRNRFYLSGLWRTAAWLDNWNRSLLGGWYPTIVATASAPWEEPTPRSSVLGRWTVLPDHYRPETGEDQMMHPHYQAPRVRGWVVQHRIPRSEVSGIGALLKVLLPGREEPFQDPLHLERAGRPEAVRMKLRKVLV